MNFLRITFWPPPEGLRSTGTGTNVRWAFKEKQNCQWLRRTLRTSSSEQSHDRIYCGYTVSTMAPECDLLGWHFCVCARACTCVCACVFLVSFSAKHSTQTARVTGQTSSPTNKLNTVHQSLFALREFTSSWKPLVKWTIFPLIPRTGTGDQHTHGYRLTLWDEWN